MKWLKRIIIAMGMAGVVLLSGFIVYTVASATAEKSGYDIGYATGQGIGYSSGKQEGYAEGFTAGKLAGYSDAYNQGKTEGYEAGIAASLGHGYTLKDPTYKQVLAFLKQDRTDGNKYAEDSYVCSHFARDVSNNAEAAGLRSAFVELRYLDGGHSLVAFNTIDKGLLLFEPQDDREVKVIIGKSYARLNNYQAPDTDDTIKDILIIW